MAISRLHRLLIAAIVLAALAVRALAFSPYAIHHPDESLQYLEQAFRLVSGAGLVPWEYRLGMRSWLPPLLLAGPMWLGERLAPGTTLYLVLPRLAVAAIALAPLWAAWAIGRRVSVRHGLVALAVVGLWYEGVYFSVHVLTETLAVALVLPGAALLLGERSRRRLAAAGALFALAALFRFHFGPAIAVLVVVTLRARWRDWAWLLAGALAPLLLSGAVDLMMGQWPYGWIAANVRYNVIEGRAARFGEYGAVAYAQMLWLAWSVGAVPILWLAFHGARRFPALAAAAAVNLLVHLAIGHKEYRFVLLTTQLAILLAAIGTVDVAAMVRRRPGPRAALWSGVALWLAGSAWLALAPTSDPGWRRFADGHRLAGLAAARRSCGVAMVWGGSWLPVGQVWLRGSTPTYYVSDPDPVRERRDAVALARAYDAVIAAPGSTSVPPAYRPVACGGAGDEALCLSVRTGGCTRDAATERQTLQAVMIRAGR